MNGHKAHVAICPHPVAVFPLPFSPRRFVLLNEIAVGVRCWTCAAVPCPGAAKLAGHRDENCVRFTGLRLANVWRRFTLLLRACGGSRTAAALRGGDHRPLLRQSPSR